MSESTRPLPPLIPLANGGWEANSFMSSTQYTIRGLGLKPSNHIVPVIVVPGIMGTNLRAKRNPKVGDGADERNKKAGPGKPVWHPPNGSTDGLRDSLRWNQRSGKERQLLLDGATLEVDGGGAVILPEPVGGYMLTDAEVRQRGWGEVYSDSYGALLHALQMRLNQTFGFDEFNKRRFVQPHWKEVMACDPQKWGQREFESLTEEHLTKHAAHYYPVYAVGYNWLEDCGTSALRLEERILQIINYWNDAKRRCDKVILVTHSMGGLVARACAKRIPEKIAGVIHGVMPAHGAPVAYRRMACGTEAGSPGNGAVKKLIASRVAKILGDSAEKTTAVLATAPGALELLPNHLYRQPWLHVRVIKSSGALRGNGYGAKDDVVRLREFPEDYLHFPNARTPNPYDLYRDLTSWYRLIDPVLADPNGKYESAKGGVNEAIWSAIATAERFHRSLGDFYHPNTYAFYGDDRNELSYDHVRWVARQNSGSPFALTAANISAAKSMGQSENGIRRVLIDGKTELHFAPDPQEARGDGTVPAMSGAGVVGKVKHSFATRGYDHQDVYNNDDTLMLTLRLIVKIVQEMS